MGGRGSGRRPKYSVQEKTLMGYREDRINREAPEPIQGDVSPPEGISPAALEVWNRVAPLLLQRGLLTSWDVYGLKAFCDAVVFFHRAADELERNGMLLERADGQLVRNPAARVMTWATRSMTSWGAKFGLDPASRQRLLR